MNKPTTTTTTQEPIQVRDLITELQRHDPATYVHFVMKNGDELFFDGFPSTPGKSYMDIRLED